MRKNKGGSDWYRAAPSRKQKRRKRRLIILAALLVCGATGFFLVKKELEKMPWEPFEITDENFGEYAPFDEAQAERIDGMPSLPEDGTWAFYVYSVGSNLESMGLNELSYYTEFLIEDEAVENSLKMQEENRSRIRRFTEDVTSQGVDLPQILYTPTVKWAEDAGYYDGEIYDPDTEGYASTDISEMMSADFNGQVRVVIQAGGANRWQNTMINPNRTQRFTIDEDGMNLVYDAVLSNMATADSLADFLSFCKENYPADHTAVIFWDHGNGAFGYGWDEIYGQLLSIADVAEAIGRVYEADAEEPPLDIIGFDACLMASAEVANELCGCAKYLAASEETEPAQGWYYTDVLNAVIDDPGINPEKLCRVIADTTVRTNIEDIAAEAGYLMPVTFSVMDLSRAGDVYNAYSEFCSKALKAALQNPSALSELSRCAQSSIAYAGSSYKVFNTIDLGIFMKGAVSAGFLTEEAGAVLDALESFVLYSRGTSYLSESEGVSVYFPARIEGISGLQYLMEYIDDISRSEAVSALYYYKIAGCLNEELKEYVSAGEFGEVSIIDYSPMKQFSSANLECSGDGNLKMHLTEEQLSLAQGVRFGLVSCDKETDDLLYLGEDGYALLDPDGTVSTCFAGKWIFLNDEPLPLEIVSQSGENITYRTPVLYNGLEAYLMTCFNAETEEVTVLGVREEMNEAGTLDRALLPLQPGARLAICYESGNLYSNASDTTCKYITVDGKMTLGEKPLPNGTYYEYILLEDIRSDVYSSQIASFDIERGEISNQTIDTAVYYYDKG